jgi:hypothetical protein
MATLALLFATVLSCKKDQDYQVSTSIDLEFPVITTFPDGTRKLDFTINIFQQGNFYYPDFTFTLKPYPDGQELVVLKVTLPTGFEVVTHSVVVAGAGNYLATGTLGTPGNGSKLSKLIIIP